MQTIRYRSRGGNVVVWKPNGKTSRDVGPLGDWECKGCHDKKGDRSRSTAESHAKNCNAC